MPSNIDMKEHVFKLGTTSEVYGGNTRKAGILDPTHIRLAYVGRVYVTLNTV